MRIPRVDEHVDLVIRQVRWLSILAAPLRWAANVLAAAVYPGLAYALYLILVGRLPLRPGPMTADPWAIRLLEVGLFALAAFVVRATVLAPWFNRRYHERIAASGDAPAPHTVVPHTSCIRGDRTVNQAARSPKQTGYTVTVKAMENEPRSIGASPRRETTEVA